MLNNNDYLMYKVTPSFTKYVYVAIALDRVVKTTYIHISEPMHLDNLTLIMCII